MTDTTQPQVTGPVDDAIDADVSALCIAFGRYIVGLPGGNADRSEVREIEERLTARLAPRAPRADDTEQIDDQVQDLLTTGITKSFRTWYDLTPDDDLMTEIHAQFRKDLASLGIRLTYDTTIGGE